MHTDSSESPHLKRLLAGLLHYGTLIASTVIALGLLLALVERYVGTPRPADLSGMQLATVGIVLFILLPVLRVIVMMIVFMHARDYRFVAIAALVLMVILLGFVLGLYMPVQGHGAH